MPKKPPPSALGIAIAAALFVAGLGVFVAPWHRGEMPPVSGEAYAFGFHNRTAIISLIAAIGVLCAGGLLSEDIRKRSDLVFDWFASAPLSTGVSFAERVVLVAGCLVMASWILWWDGMLVIPYWGEADYFLSRIDLVAMGYRPYVDFQYNYGPLLLDLPLLLDGLSQGSLGIENAYAWTVVGMTVVGFCAIWFFLRSLSLPDSFRPWALAMALAIWAPLTMGLNYVPLRFTFLPFALAACDRLVTSMAGSGRSYLWITAAVTVLCAVAFLISPEMGVACAVGLFAYSGFRGLGAGRSAAFYVMIGIAIAVLAVGSFSKGYFEGLKAFAGGANNFPIFPNIHNLLLIITALSLLSAIGIATLSHRTHPRAPFAAAVAAAATVLLAPALGRCDPGHVLLNELMLFFCVFPVMASLGKRWLWAWSGVYAIAFIAAMQMAYWYHYAGSYRYALDAHHHYTQHPEQVAAWREAWEQRRLASDSPRLPNWRRVAPYPAWADQHEEMRGRVGLPLAADIGLDRYAKLAKRYVPPFHPVPKTEILTPAGVDRAVVDALQTSLIVLPEGAAATAKAGGAIDLQSYAKHISHFLSGLMLYPVSLTPRRPPFMPDIEVSRRLLDACELRGVGNGIVVLRPRSLPEASRDETSHLEADAAHDESR